MSTFSIGSATAAAAADSSSSDSSSSSSSGGSLPPSKTEKVVEATSPDVKEGVKQTKPVPDGKSTDVVGEKKKGGCPFGVGCAILDNFTGEGISFTIVWIILVVLAVVIALGATLHHLHKRKSKKWF